MRKDFNEHQMTQVPMTENQLEGMNYTEVPDSRFVAQPVDDCLFPWEEAGSAENPITIHEDEGFLETMTPQNTPPQHPPAMRSIENLQNSSAAP